MATITSTGLNQLAISFQNIADNFSVELSDTTEVETADPATVFNRTLSTLTLNPTEIQFDIPNGTTPNVEKIVLQTTGLVHLAEISGINTNYSNGGKLVLESLSISLGV